MYQSEVPDRLIKYIELLKNEIQRLTDEQALFPTQMRMNLINDKNHELIGLEKGLKLFAEKK